MTTNRNLMYALAAVIAVPIFAHRAFAEEPKKTLADWDEISDLDNDCHFESAQPGSKVTITVPNTSHDLNPRRGMNAPRLLRKATGNFSVQVKVTSDFKPGQGTTGGGAPFNGAGLLIWQDEDNFLRLERNAFGGPNQLYCYPPLIEHWRYGSYAGVNSRAVKADDFFQGDSTWLKLQRKGDSITASYSHDGKEWTVAKEFPIQFADKISVGVAALNTSDKEFIVEFESFRISSEQ